MKPLIISVGDPAGIGPEIVFRSLEPRPKTPVVLVCDWALTRQHLDLLRIEPRVQVTRELGDVFSGVTILDIASSSGETLRPGEPGQHTAKAALDSVTRAADLMNEGVGRALVTAPVSKEAIASIEPGFRGHTELLAAMTGRTSYGRDFAMLFDSPTLTVILASVHLPLRDAIESIDSAMLASLISLGARALADLGRPNPRIAVAGLNPHAGEGGMFGQEEESVASAVETAHGAGIDASGPYPPDTVFHLAASGRFDLVVALYHDQGLIPVKTLHFAESVNATVGLPWLRASVDHGTAFDIAGSGTADHTPMRWATEWAIRHSRGRT